MTFIIEYGFLNRNVKRLHVGNRYYWVEAPSYGCPVFWENQACTKELDIWSDESDDNPIWEAYQEMKQRK